MECRELDGAGLAGWQFGDMRFDKDVEIMDVFDYQIGTRLIRLKIERKPGFYIWKLFFPLVLIVVMASMVFWIDWV